MCGFQNNCAKSPVSDDELLSQYEVAMRECPENAIVKIYTSGSFFDSSEVSSPARDEILSRLSKDVRVEKVIIETLPEHVSPDIFKMDKKIELAIGVETSSDEIRRRCINKGFGWRDFVEACKIAISNGATIKAYLLLKPLFISEKQALLDVITSAKDVEKYAMTISINLCNVQRGTLMEKLWRRKEYRPPWLWSASEALYRIKSEIPERIVISDPVGAGSPRGPHNCRKCSQEVATRIRRFSLSQDVRELDFYCRCRETWEEFLELEDLTFGGSFVP